MTPTITPDTRTERAWRAYHRMVKMLPALSAFARALTRDSTVSVKLCDKAHPTPCTDGKVIYLRPPMELGDDARHERHVCYQRDPETKRQLCPACQQSDYVLSTLMHEIAHIVEGSFTTIDDESKADITRRVLEETPTMPGKRIDKLVKELKLAERAYGRLTYIHACKAISPYLHPIFNALEDARVNRNLIKSRPGAKPMFEVKVLDVFTNGILQEDGTTTHWRDAGKNMQIIVGLYVKASGFDYKGWFHPDVEKALDDFDLGMELMGIANATSPATVYRVGFPVLEHLRRLGFCKRIEDAEDDPPPVGGDPPPSESDEDEGDEDDDQEGGDSTAESDDSDNDEGDESSSGGMSVPEEDDDDDAGSSSDGGSDDSYDDDDDDAEGDDDDAEGDDDDAEGDDDDDDDAEDGDAGSGGGGGDDDAEDDDPDDIQKALDEMGGHAKVAPTMAEDEDEKAIDTALRQGENFDAPSKHVIDVKVHKYDDPMDYYSGWRGTGVLPRDEYEALMPGEGLVATSLLKARIAFAANKRGKIEGGYRSGRVISHRLAAVPAGETRVFGKVTRPKRRDYHVTVMLDMSGSTGSIGRGGALYLIARLGLAVGELLNRLGVKFEIIGHSGTRADAYTSLDDLALDLFVIKEAHDPWNDKTRSAIANLKCVGANLDGHAMEYARKRLDRASATDRMILYVTDGSMPLENYADELEVLQREIKTIKRSGYHVLGVGVYNDDPTRHGLDTVRLDKVEDLPKLIKEIERRLEQ